MGTKPVQNISLQPRRKNFSKRLFKRSRAIAFPVNQEELKFVRQAADTRGTNSLFGGRKILIKKFAGRLTEAKARAPQNITLLMEAVSITRAAENINSQ